MKIKIRFNCEDLEINYGRDCYLELSKEYADFKKKLKPILKRNMPKVLKDISKTLNINDWIITVDIYNNFFSEYKDCLGAFILVSSKDMSINGELIFRDGDLEFDEENFKDRFTLFTYSNQKIVINCFKQHATPYLVLRSYINNDFSFSRFNVDKIIYNQVQYENLLILMKLTDINLLKYGEIYCKSQSFLVSDSIKWMHHYKITQGIKQNNGFVEYDTISKLHPIEHSGMKDFLNVFIESKILNVDREIVDSLEDLNFEQIKELIEISKVVNY